MPTLPPEIMILLVSFAPLFTTRTWQYGFRWVLPTFRTPQKGELALLSPIFAPFTMSLWRVIRRWSCSVLYPGVSPASAHTFALRFLPSTSYISQPLALGDADTALESRCVADFTSK